MRTLIAEIKLAPGQVGFYDELTNIHLTLTYPYGKVYKGMNTTNLQRGVRSGRLILLSGSLVPTPVIMKEEEKAQYVVKTPEAANVKLDVEPRAVAFSMAEEVVEEIAEEVVEETIEEVVEETTEEEKSTKSKKASKKK